jgi:hypothetical protein
MDDIFLLFGPKSEKVTQGWIKMRNGNLNNFHLSYIITMFNSRRLRLARHVACMGAVGYAYKILVVNMTPFCRLGIGGWIIHKHQTYRNRVRRCGLDSSGSR